jgi:hypothetical protein
VVEEKYKKIRFLYKFNCDLYKMKISLFPRILLFKSTNINFATLFERGLAAEIREKYNISEQERKVLHKIVHEKNDKPTVFTMPIINKKKLSINKKWNSHNNSVQQK